MIIKLCQVSPQKRSVDVAKATSQCIFFSFIDGALQAGLASLQLETKNVRIAPSHNGGV